ncbi:MAG: hypothetical protein DCF15_07790 [Phormidesmis priestleyi]|uniref:Uncharacterized protein n=1 Tax=Phormidesmis priestleyi TaxID=268141 RepID=A0A2W4XI74_9CYAN|nr:MAG: hypothetical protein DCF15_07790 [Phormidesmis priestleyi]
MFVITIRSLYLNFNQRSKLKIGRAIARVLLQILVFILIALAMIPVALLPISTTVPPSIQILFAMAAVALLIAIFRLGFSVRVVLADLQGLWRSPPCHFRLATIRVYTAHSRCQQPAYS